jgi:hypothetical protein
LSSASCHELICRGAGRPGGPEELPVGLPVTSPSRSFGEACRVVSQSERQLSTLHYRRCGVTRPAIWFSSRGRLGPDLPSACRHTASEACLTYSGCSSNRQQRALAGLLLLGGPVTACCIRHLPAAASSLGGKVGHPAQGNVPDLRATSGSIRKPRVLSRPPPSRTRQSSRHRCSGWPDRSGTAIERTACPGVGAVDLPPRPHTYLILTLLPLARVPDTW